MIQVGRPRMRLGVTGGIGSGKTSVCRVFKVLGIPVFSADPEARRIMSKDDNIIKGINKIAGRDLFTEGNLDRTELARIIFKDPHLLAEVNALVHPAVFKEFERWAEEQTSPYSIMEAAILFESGASSLVDRVVTVVAPVEERIQRLIIGKKMSRADIMERIRNQMDDESKMKLSDYVIQNSENDMIIPAILRIHEDILNHLNS